jgi:glucokinase
MKYAIGLDSGGTKISGVLFDGKKIVRELTINTPKTLFEFLYNVKRQIKFLSRGVKISGVGIGIAGLVDNKKGVAVTSPNIRYIKNLNLVRELKSREIKKIAVDNDASCFLRGEWRLGQARGYKNAIGLTLGTGVGGAFVIDGKMYRGSRNMGGEAGRMVMLDSFWEKLFQQARDKKDYKTLGKLLGMGLANLINLFDPDCVIVGGSVMTNHKNIILPQAKKELRRVLNKNSTAKIFVSNLKHAGALGAALMISDKS